MATGSTFGVIVDAVRSISSGARAGRRIRLTRTPSMPGVDVPGTLAGRLLPVAAALQHEAGADDEADDRGAGDQLLAVLGDLAAPVGQLVDAVAEVVDGGAELLALALDVLADLLRGAGLGAGAGGADGGPGVLRARRAGCRSQPLRPVLGERRAGALGLLDREVRRRRGALLEGVLRDQARDPGDDQEEEAPR